MDDGRPTTWHYGLVARWWAETNVAEPDELAYYGGAIDRAGGPALDLGCGAGRLLVPLLAAGRDVDGVDVSRDMLDRAIEVGAASSVDLTGRLHAQAFDALELPRRYGTIYCSDSFAIGGSRARDEKALRRVLNHLEPGGAFVFSYDLPEEVPASTDLPWPWAEQRRRRRLLDGDELELATRLAALDLEAGVETLEIQVRLWRGATLLAEETGVLQTMRYEREDLVRMLGAAGFVEVAIEGRYTRREAAPDDATIVAVARRPPAGDSTPSRPSRNP